MASESKSSQYNRRVFLENSARNAAGLAAGAMGLGVTSSPNERLQIGVIGLGSQGEELTEALSRTNMVEIVAICDVDARSLAYAQHEIANRQTSKPVAVGQHEQLLEKSDIDAVVIATPDHWHARMTADALLTGKDVFLETPVAHSIHDGERLCRLAEQTDRIVQVGLPQRHGTHFQSAIQLVQSGFLGKIHLAKAWAVHRRKSIGRCATSQPPMGVDYNRWLGPAEGRPFQENRFHQSWPWFWDFGSGELGLWGVHHLDVIRWALKLDLPNRVVATGGKRSFKDDRETPDTLSVHYDYPDVEVVWEHRQWSNRGIEGRSSGVAFYGDAGMLVVDRSGWKVYDHRQDGHADASDIKNSQMSSFVKSVSSRTAPVVGLRDGQNSSSLCHLGNIAYRLGREVSFDHDRKNFGADAEANDFLESQSRDPWRLTEEKCRTRS
ncbi:Gfo/Idh/MocA family protein [Thalassoglobus polymorphus]|uniref:Alpha-N-acetylgalactosaminidase n=1 Tax=Thalassoglobus polymorphus TaxID=2527994 RepID=A0A517QGU4_9PLAN|nr:Gfo/Idh/MocA family oxidoreductase [Thalassoglobus polymorphus]QDT30841.1 Alpha-N-acetylgalactosaminidase [Thalassoglobus polymorphus]